ncbi:MAG: glutamate--tRNA ligase [Pseudomonadota bacterium]|nr:glutamate--tRNA ligase [Pseudomonadota bacterium]
MTIRTRFAPSPTGFLHIGGARTALYCYLEARRRGGQFILRIEDTDRERSSQASVDAILDGMEWLGLDYDEGPFYQTERLDRYRHVAEDLVRQDKAYRCWCSKERLDAMREAQMAAGEKPRYDGRCREHAVVIDGVTPVIRFRNPQLGSVIFTDQVRGRIEISNTEMDDLIIWRSDDFPTYNFAVVVDDIDMKITEVIRGEDHINNTPRQINIYRALNATPPQFAHLPMIHGPDGAKLSKRHGAVSVMQYRDDGYLPHALLNYIARLGWSHGDQEIFSFDELRSLFRVEDVNRAPSRFDFDKLAWLNQHYMKSDSPAEVAKHLMFHLRELDYDLSRGPKVEDVVIALRDRVKTLKEMAERARCWYLDLDGFDAESANKHLLPAATAGLGAAREQLAAIALEDWSPTRIDAALRAAAEAVGLGLGKVAQPLRVAMTGSQVSPSIDHTVYLVGRERTMTRIDAAIRHIKAAAG